MSLLLAAGAAVDDEDGDGETALTWASMTGHDDIIRTLIAAGADFQHEAPGRPIPLVRCL